MKRTAGSKNAVFRGTDEPPKPEEEKSELEMAYEGPKFLGMDYFRVIYISVTVLVLLMGAVYFTVEDEKM